MSPYVRPSDIRAFAAIMLGFILIGLTPVIGPKLSQMYDEVKTAQLREESTPEWQARNLSELARLKTAIALELKSCPTWKGLSRKIGGDHVPADHHQHVYEYNRLVDYFVTVQMRSLGGSQYRGVEEAFPQKMQDCWLT